ncbi:hypothetical protein [Moraxella lacunata]
MDSCTTKLSVSKVMVSISTHTTSSMVFLARLTSPILANVAKVSSS